MFAITAWYTLLLTKFELHVRQNARLLCIVPFRRWFTGGDKFFWITHGTEFERRVAECAGRLCPASSAVAIGVSQGDLLTSGKQKFINKIAFTV